LFDVLDTRVVGWYNAYNPFLFVVGCHLWRRAWLTFCEEPKISKIIFGSIALLEGRRKIELVLDGPKIKCTFTEKSITPDFNMHANNFEADTIHTEQVLVPLKVRR
jgi:hypothetical protein